MSHFQASRYTDRTSSRTKAETREATALEVKDEIDAERRDIDERTAKLRAMQLARENAAP